MSTSDYHSNDNTWDRHDPIDPHSVICRECGGQGGRHDNECGKCSCWVGHGACGGCSGYPGIKHEPACGWEQNPDCPVHGDAS